MSWGEPKGKSLHIMLIPVVFMTFFLFSGTNFTNDSIECVDYDGQCFAPVDELINQSTDTNESEFIDVDEYFNSTEESNQTMLEPELPPKQTNQTNNTEQDEFIDVDNLFNSTEESNQTTEEFVEVEEFLNSTNQSELPEISEVEAPLNLTLVNESLSRANKTEAPTRSAVIPFSLVSANGATANASVSFIQNGKEVAPLLAEGKMRAASAQIANTRFGVPPGKYTLEVVPSKTPSASKDGLLPVPVNKVLLKEVEITESTMPSLKLEGLAASATPFGKETKQAYAIDPTSFNFTEGEVSVTAKGSELYKCAEWAYDEQKCNGKWIKIMELIPGEEYIVLINATDPAYAEYNSTLGAPRCANYTSPCIANSTLLRSRDSLTTPEPNQPNTVDGCTDGGSGTYQNDESVENITIESLTAPYDVFNEGDTVRVNATVYCWSTGASDNINFVYSSDATSPSWSVVGYVDPCPGNGFQQVSATFSLDNVLGEHVIRVINQYNGNTATTCGGGNYDDNDDLVFPVNGTAPAVNLVYPTANWIVCKGVEAFIFNTSQAGSCQLYIDGELDQATTINAAADTNYQFNASVLTSGLHNWSVRCSGVDSETRNFFLCPKYIIYQDTFQSSGGFSPDATNTAPWQRGDATQVGGCHRSDSCWATGLASNYFATGPYDDMLTQQVALNLSNYENVSMAFYHYRYFEDATTIYDAGVVEINNGTGWTRLTPQGGYSGTVDNGYGNSLGNQQAYGNHGPGWELEQFNLSTYSGDENVSIRFYFAADSSVNDRGWFVDDVKIYGDPLVFYHIESIWDDSDFGIVVPGENDTFYANYTYLNTTPVVGPPGTCNITTNATYPMTYNPTTKLYEYNQSFPAPVNGTFIVVCQKNASFVADTKASTYSISGDNPTNISCWATPNPITPAYPGGYNRMFLFCNYTYTNGTPVNSNGVCKWQDSNYIDYYFFGQETFDQRDVDFFGEKQVLYSFDGVWSELNKSRGHGKVACYNETLGTMTVRMCLDYLNTSLDTNTNLNNSNDSANCFFVGQMNCDQFAAMSGEPKGTFAWASMDLNMTDYYSTLQTVGNPRLVDMQWTYECANCSYSLFTTPYNVSEYGADLVTQHHFDEFVDTGSANVSVDAAGKLNLTEFGTVGISPGQVNKSFNFSTQSGFLYAPDVVGFDVLDAITVQAYVKVESHVPQERVIMSKWAYSPIARCGAAMNEICINQRSGRIFLDKSGHLSVELSHNGKDSGIVSLRDPQVFPENEWAQVGFVFNGTHIRLYRNSLIVAETDSFSGYKIYDGTAPWVVGADDAGNHSFATNTQIDELRVIKRGLADWEFVSAANSDFWLIKSQSIPETLHTYVSQNISGNLRNFTREETAIGENLVKLSVWGQSLNMSFNSTTGLYGGHRAVPYGYHPGTYTINFSCTKPSAEDKQDSADWEIYAEAPTCSVDGYLNSIPLGSYQYVNWSINSNVPPQLAYYNITHADGHVYSYHNTEVENGQTYVNHAQGTGYITCYVENENSSYSSSVPFNITPAIGCFYATGANANYTLGADLFDVKQDSACITIEAENVTIDCGNYTLTGVGTGSGVRSYGLQGTVLKNCNISSYGTGIYWGHNHNSTIENNRVWNSSEGIYLSFSENNTVLGNVAQNNTKHGLVLYQSSHNNDVFGNSLFNNTLNGLWVNISSNYNEFENNSIHDNNNYGVYTDQCHYNLFFNNSVYRNVDYGIYVLGSTFVNFTNNTVFENDLRGFSINGGSSNNQFINNTVRNNSQQGFYARNSDHNVFDYNTIYGNSQGIYLRLCENNTLNYNTIYSAGSSVAGFRIQLSTDNSMSHNLVYQNLRGFRIENSHNNTLYNNTVYGNSDSGIRLDSGSQDNNVTNCTSYGNTFAGFYILNAGTGSNRLTNLTSYGNQYGFAVLGSNDELINSHGYSNTLAGLAISNTHGTYVDPSYFCNNPTGINISGSENITIDDSVACNNTNYGIYIEDSTNVTLNRSRTYNNSGEDLYVETDATARTLQIYNFTFDNPYGNFTNFTNISLIDTVNSNSAYTISWMANAVSLPTGKTSFAQKFINISAQSGTVSIDKILWQWAASELTGYDETLFQLWKYNSTGWTLLNATPDTSAHTLTQYSLNPASEYGILEDVSNCPVISSEGTYLMSKNHVGAPNDASEIGLDWACIKIASSNVILDCNGYNITNNATSNATAIAVNGSTASTYNNITIQNCPSITQYLVGVYITNSTNNTITNSTAYNNTEEGIYLQYSEYATIEYSNITNNTDFGLEFHYSNYTTIIHNNIDGNGNDGIGGLYSDYTNISYNNVSGNNGDSIFNYVSTGSYYAHNLIDGEADPTSILHDIYNVTFYLGVDGANSDGFDIPNNAFGTVFNNTIRHSYLGIRCDECEDMQIDQNDIYNALILIGSSNMSDSNVTSNTMSTAASSGFYLINAIQGTWIHNNTVTNASHNGFYLNSHLIPGSVNNNITNNTFHFNSWHGAFVENSTTNSLFYNNISNNTQYGLTNRFDNDTTIVSNIVSGNGLDGIESVNSSYLNISFNTADSNGEDSIDIYSGEGNWIEGNSITTPGRDGVNVPNNINSTVLNNNITDPVQIGVRCDWCRNVSILNNNITQASAAIGTANMEECIVENNIVLSSSEGLYCINDCNNNNFTNNTVGNNNYGIYLWKTTGNIFSKNTIYGSNTAGIYIWNATQNSLHNNTVYDNPYGLYVRNTAPVPIIYNMTNTLFLPSSGALENYTNLSVSDSVEAATTYIVNWSVYTGPIAPYISFDQKYVNISTIAGSPSLDRVVWHWLDSEVSAGGYTESRFELWKANSSGTYLLNESPDTSANTLSQYNLNPASDYGILENNQFILNISCWFDPLYQEPTAIRDVWCNVTNEDGAAVSDATVTHGTYDVNDWYLNGIMAEKGWIVGYKRITNLTTTNYNTSATYRITNQSNAHIRYGAFFFPFPQINQTFNLLAKAGTNASLLRIYVCNNTYSDSIYGNIPISFDLPSAYPGCAYAGAINATEQGVNPENWTWASLEITSAFNSITSNMSGAQNYSIHLSSTDEFIINPVGWSIDSKWLPPQFNNTLEAYRMLNSTYDFEEGGGSGLPSGGGYDPDYNINMSGNVGLWKLDEGSGTTIEDVSGNGNNGTITGTQYTLGLTPAPQNKTIHFNNSYGTGAYGDDIIVVPHDSSLNFNTEGSVCSWVYVSGAEQWQGMVHKGNLSNFNNAEYALQMLGNGVQPTFVITSSSGVDVYPTGASNLELNRWYYLCGTFNSTTVAIWVDGELEDTTANTIGTPRQSTGSLQIGAQLTQDYNTALKKLGFNGRLDEVAIFNRSLSTQEIQQIFHKGSKKLLPDNRTYNLSEVDIYQHYILMSDTLGFDPSTTYVLFDENDDVAQFQNKTSFVNVKNSSFTHCFFLKRDRLSNSDEILYSAGTGLNLRLINSSGNYEVQMNVRRTGSVGVTTLVSSGNSVGDLDWHHVCAVRSKTDGALALLVDGQKVDETPFDNGYMLQDPTQVLFGRDLDINGGGNNFQGQIAQFFLLNVSVSSADIAEGINNAFWEIAISNEEEPGVYAEGQIQNSTSILWQEEPDTTPIAYIKLRDLNTNMSFNSTGSDSLYHTYYYTNRAEYATSQGILGVNFTTLFNATRPGSVSANDTKYWYVRAVTNSSCTINSFNWTNTSKTGQYQDWFVNWSVNSSTPLISQGLVVCSPSGFCHTYSSPGVVSIEENYEYGTHEFYCFSQNDYDAGQYNSSNETFDVGCWSTYDDYDGTEDPLIMQDDVYVCPGFHTAVPKNNSYVLVNNGEQKLFLLGQTTVDGNNVRYGSGQWGSLYWAYNLSDRLFDAQGYLTVQNGEIAFYTDKYVNNYTFAGVHFINMSIGYDLEHTQASNFYVFNNTFTGCGIDGEDAIYVSGPNVQIIGNNFSSPAATQDTNVYCDGCSNVSLEQNYYWDIGNLEIYTDGTSRTASTPVGNITCTVGTFGTQYPYANYSLLNGTNYTNGADLYGEIIDWYPCTTKEYSSCQVISSAGTYALSQNAVGAPNDATEVGDISWACIKIASSNVDFSCNGFNITNNGTLDAAAILINGSDSQNYTNVTIRDCPSISLYEKGAYIYNSTQDTIQNVSAHNNTEAGIRLSGSSNNTLTNNSATNNGINGFYFTADSPDNDLASNIVCSNVAQDLYSLNGTNFGTLDTCDSWNSWSEFSHPGCTFRCTDVWQYFYGDVDGDILLAPTQTDIFYSWNWNGDAGAIYAISENATIDWVSLIALGRNTTQQNSTNDFTELDTLLGITTEPDNINDTYSYDGSNPKQTENATLFGHFVPYLPIANSTVFNNGFNTGIAWDSSQGGSQFNTVDDQDVVFASEINGSSTYDYEIRVPETFATYKGGTTVEFWVELD